MQVTIISDTSCLILLEKIGELDLLQKLYKNILVTQIIANEYGKFLPVWIQIENPKDLRHLILLETSLDKGEASAIALAMEKEQCLLIIDDLKGRKLAKKLGVAITGTF